MSGTRRANDSGALRSPGATQYPRAGAEVLVSAVAEYLAYGEALARAIRLRHPEVVVRYAAPTELAAREARPGPRLLVGVRSGVSGLAADTIELSPDPAGLSRFHVGGKSWSSRNPELEEILAAMDEALTGSPPEAAGG